MSHFNIISNINNGVGLEWDSKLLKSLLESWGHTAKLVHYRKRNETEEAPRAAANIFLEVVNYDLLARNIAKENWFIPNPEWFAPWDHKNGPPDPGEFCILVEGHKGFHKDGEGNEWRGEIFFYPAVRPGDSDPALY